jgi:3' exoribonuclease family, domain 1
MLLSHEFATNPLSRADGSALWTTGKHPLNKILTFKGNTKVLVSINGPIEVPRRDELVSETTIDIQFRPISGFPGSFLQNQC